jgi:hypothetical protein
MTPDLSRRLGRVLGTTVLPADERWRIIEAAMKANTFADLPTDIQGLVGSLEAKPK